MEYDILWPQELSFEKKLTKDKETRNGGWNGGGWGVRGNIKITTKWKINRTFLM